MAKKHVTEDQEEDSYVAAKKTFDLFGKGLKPYTASRKVAADAMGLLYPNVGDAGRDQFSRTNTYPGLLRDVIVVLWLCSLPNTPQEAEKEENGMWTPSLALTRPQEASEAAIAWAEKSGIDSTGADKFKEAFQVFIAIVSGVEAAKFQLETNDRSAPEESGKV